MPRLILLIVALWILSAYFLHEEPAPTFTITTQTIVSVETNIQFLSKNPVFIEDFSTAEPKPSQHPEIPVLLSEQPKSAQTKTYPPTQPPSLPKQAYAWIQAFWPVRSIEPSEAVLSWQIRTVSAVASVRAFLPLRVIDAPNPLASNATSNASHAEDLNVHTSANSTSTNAETHTASSNTAATSAETNTTPLNTTNSDISHTVMRNTNFSSNLTVPDAQEESLPPAEATSTNTFSSNESVTNAVQNVVPASDSNMAEPANLPAAEAMPSASASAEAESPDTNLRPPTNPIVVVDGYTLRARDTSQEAILSPDSVEMSATVPASVPFQDWLGVYYQDVNFKLSNMSISGDPYSMMFYENMRSRVDQSHFTLEMQEQVTTRLSGELALDMRRQEWPQSLLTFTRSLPQTLSNDLTVWLAQNMILDSMALAWQHRGQWVTLYYPWKAYVYQVSAYRPPQVPYHPFKLRVVIVNTNGVSLQDQLLAQLSSPYQGGHVNEEHPPVESTNTTNSNHSRYVQLALPTNREEKAKRDVTGPPAKTNDPETIAYYTWLLKLRKALYPKEAFFDEWYSIRTNTAKFY